MPTDNIAYDQAVEFFVIHGAVIPEFFNRVPDPSEMDRVASIVIDRGLRADIVEIHKATIVEHYRRKQLAEVKNLVPFSEACKFFARLDNKGMDWWLNNKPDFNHLDALVNRAYNEKHDVAKVQNHAQEIIVHWAMSRSPTELSDKHTVTDDFGDGNLIMDCQLEYDWRRGVIYVHSKKHGITTVRINGLSKRDSKPREDFQIDIMNKESYSKGL